MTAAVDERTLSAPSPPHDDRAERAVLGAVMLNRDVADAISEILLPEDFYQPKHMTVFSVAMNLLERGDTPDAVAVTHELDRRGELTRISVPFLHEILETPPTAANGPHYARIVAELAVRRRLAEAGDEIVRISRDPAEISEVTDRAAQVAFDATTDRRQQASIEHVGDLAGPVLQHIDDVAFGRVQPGIPTGFADLDSLTGGMHPGQLIIPAGRTGMGKSVFAQNCTHFAARNTGRPAILFSVELSRDEMMQRLLSEITRIPLTNIREGKLDNEAFAKLVDAERYLREVPLFLVDNVRTVAAIRAACRRFRRQRGDLALVAVDYLQRLHNTSAVRRDRHEVVGEFANQLKDLAQDMGIPVIAPCQLNRGPENRTGKEANRPRMADLRESGDIEQTADQVILIYRPDYYDRSHARAGTADFMVEKNRNGPTGIATVASLLQVQKFANLERI